ncbi:hypothetical protein ABBQ32_005675 [Trebouxia sp. C0010 RCD-2024]
MTQGHVWAVNLDLSGTCASVEQSREVVQQLHDTYRRSKFSQRFNVALEDRLWALDCVHSRSVEIPKPFSELLDSITLCTWVAGSSLWDPGTPQLAASASLYSLHIRFVETPHPFNWVQPVLTSSAMLIAAGVFGLSPVRRRPRSKTMLNLTLLALVLTAGPVVYSIILYGARQPGGQTGTALLPLFDMLNHDVKQEGAWLTSSWTGNSFRITAATEGFEPHQEGNVPAARVDALAADHKLHTAIDSFLAHVMLQVSLKKGGAGREVIKALCFLLATPDEVQKAEEAGRSTGQWLADVLEYRQLPTATTPFDYITLSNATEMRVQQAGSPPLSLQAQLLMPVLHNFCSFVLKSKPTSVKADEAELSELSKNQPLSQNETRRLLAIQFRYGKKKILQSCIRKHQKMARLLSGG